MGRLAFVPDFEPIDRSRQLFQALFIDVLFFRAPITRCKNKSGTPFDLSAPHPLSTFHGTNHTHFTLAQRPRFNYRTQTMERVPSHAGRRCGAYRYTHKLRGSLQIPAFQLLPIKTVRHGQFGTAEVLRDAYVNTHRAGSGRGICHRKEAKGPESVNRGRYQPEAWPQNLQDSGEGRELSK
jgi:hypothetical protein